MEDGKKAREMAMNMGSGYHTSLVFRYLDTFPRPQGVPAWPQLIPEPTAAQLEERIASGNRIVGDPDECARGVQMYADVGCDQLIFGILASTQPQSTALRSVELFGKHVIPRFDEDPVHSTARMREAALQEVEASTRAMTRPADAVADRPRGDPRLRHAVARGGAEHGLRRAVGSELPAAPRSGASRKPATAAGFFYLAVSDHVCVPRSHAAAMSTVWYDTVATLGFHRRRHSARSTPLLRLGRAVPPSL